MGKTTEVYVLGGDARGFSAAVQTARRGLGQLVAGAQTAIGTFGGMRAIVPAVTAIGTAVALIGGRAVSAASDFDAAMRSVAAKTGATGAELVRLTEQAREMGRTTVHSATEAARGQAFLAAGRIQDPPGHGGAARRPGPRDCRRTRPVARRGHRVERPQGVPPRDVADRPGGGRTRARRGVDKHEHRPARRRAGEGRPRRGRRGLVSRGDGRRHRSPERCGHPGRGGGDLAQDDHGAAGDRDPDAARQAQGAWHRALQRRWEPPVDHRHHGGALATRERPRVAV